MSNELALANAIASVEMEGLYLSDEGYDLCRRYSNREITWNEFLVKALVIYPRPTDTPVVVAQWTMLVAFQYDAKEENLQ